MENEGFAKDVTGLIGQYAHGNEPSHHVAYLYTMAGKPHKTEEIELNEKPFVGNVLKHSEIVSGGILKLFMTDGQ